MYKNNPLVSVLISSYNHDIFIQKCIDSVINQNYSPVEVIVVDNDSKDKSQAILESFGNRINVIFQDNKGPMGAFNTGFAASSGEIICFLDSDDFFFPEKVSRVVETFQTYPEISWFYHALNVVDKRGSSLNLTPIKRTGKLDIRNYIKRSGLFPVGITNDSGVCLDRKIFEKMYPLPEETLLSVSDRYIKVVASSMTEGYFEDQPLAGLRVHGLNFLSGSQRDKTFSMLKKITISEAYWMSKYWPQLRRFANRSIGQGIGLFHRTGEIDAYHEKLMNVYLSSTSIQDKLEIKLFEIYSRYFWNPTNLIN
jgi:glycosyltransferase involved in cell wall biosynthesis